LTTCKIHSSADVSGDANIGKGTIVWNNCQIRERAVLGENCILAKNVYIDAGVKIGNNCKLQNNVSIYFDCEIDDGVFVGPHVCFTNDKLPRAINEDGSLKNRGDWPAGKIKVGRGASIGAGAIILPDVSIGEFAMIGAGALVTKDVEKHTLVLGSPARPVDKVCYCGNKLKALYCLSCNKKINI
jgi:UDP-2-acetamido-3-amino-2,3-dideoxy-glucuronate N-acetyltransferase